jgi:hypothetical protein
MLSIAASLRLDAHPAVRCLAMCCVFADSTRSVTADRPGTGEIQIGAGQLCCHGAGPNLWTTTRHVDNLAKESTNQTKTVSP